MKQQIDVNSDMGEGFGPWLIGDGVDDEILPLITSTHWNGSDAIKSV